MQRLLVFGRVTVSLYKEVSISNVLSSRDRGPHHMYINWKNVLELPHPSYPTVLEPRLHNADLGLPVGRTSLKFDVAGFRTALEDGMYLS